VVFYFQTELSHLKARSRPEKRL